MKKLYSTLLVSLLFPLTSWATVTVTNPFNSETVGTTANYVASATTSTCSKGVDSLGVYVDGALIQTVNGSQMSISVAFWKRLTRA